MKFHRAHYNGYNGYYFPQSGHVKFGKMVYPSIEVAIKYLK